MLYGFWYSTYNTIEFCLQLPLPDNLPDVGIEEVTFNIDQENLIEGSSIWSSYWREMEGASQVIEDLTIRNLTTQIIL